MPLKIADPPPANLKDVWGLDENDRPIRLFRKPRPTVWGLTADGKPDPMEDDEPVDSPFAAQLCRLLINILCHNWSGSNARPFEMFADCGLFFEQTVPPLVPDAMLSLDIPSEIGLNVREFRRAYIAWELGKLPEVVFEVVSKTRNDEEGEKLEAYESIGIPHYVLYDPCGYSGDEMLQVFDLRRGKYRRSRTNFLDKIGLGVKLWTGEYQGREATWLRWCDEQGKLLPTAEESAKRYKLNVQSALQKAEAEKQRAEAEKQRAEAAEDLVKKLTAKLQASGITE